MKEVRVYARMCGDYAAWHEANMYVEYDITNDKQLGEHSLEELKNWERGGYSDVDIVTAYLDDDGNYYIKLW